MLNLLIFLAVLSILVLVHELGHFLPAKKAGIRVEEFGLGYPPRIWKKKLGKMIFSLNLLPLGGFVKLYGEELEKSTEEKFKKSKDAFWSKSKAVRMAVIAGGVVANFLLAVILFAIVYSVMGVPAQTEKVLVIGVTPSSPAAKAGILPDDQLLILDGQPLKDLKYFTDLIAQKAGQQIQLEVLRGKEKLDFSVAIRSEPPENEGPLGVVVSDYEMKHYPFWQMPFRGIVEGFKEAFSWASLVIQGLGKMLANIFTKGELPKDVAGPVGIFQITSGVAKGGILSLLQFIGILSVNLAVINFLPFPALDGGRFVFVLYEVITRKRPAPNIERWANTAGMAFLLFLVALVTVNDISRIWQASPLADQIKGFWPF